MFEYGECMKKNFSFNPEYVLVNHGSFGVAGKEPFDLRLKLIAEMEDQADVWVRHKIRPMWRENLLSVADFLGSKPENLVFVSNTTTGINCIMRSLKLNKGDGILINTWTYVAVKNLLKYIEKFMEVEIHVVNFPEQIDNSQCLVDLYEEALRKYLNVKIAILDYISSMPASLMPIAELISICKKYDKLVIVDGAHVPGQVSLNIESLCCDFFVGNLHKWCYAPRGCAVLWVDPKFHKVIFPSVISTYNDTGDLSDLFFYQGTADTTQHYVAKCAIDFYEKIGGYENISKYCTSLIDEATSMLVEKWKTKQFSIPDDMKAPCMRVILLPKLKNYEISAQLGQFSIDMSKLMLHIWKTYKIQTVCISMYGKAWIRISVNVYNTIEDYKKLGDAIESLAIL